MVGRHAEQGRPKARCAVGKLRAPDGPWNVVDESEVKRRERLYRRGPRGSCGRRT